MEDSTAGCAVLEVSRRREQATSLADPVPCLLAGKSKPEKSRVICWPNSFWGVAKNGLAGLTLVSCSTLGRAALWGKWWGIFWARTRMQQQGVGARKHVWFSESMASSSDLYGPHWNTDLIFSEQSTAYLEYKWRAKRSHIVSIVLYSIYGEKCVVVNKIR